MKTLITKILDSENGPKIFYSDYKRVQLLFSPISSFEETTKNIENTFKDDEGVYIFVGSSEKGQIAYIGETDNLKRRLEEHKKKAQNYNDLVFIYSNQKMMPYSKTDLHYLEGKIISRFEHSNFIVNNRNKGQGKSPIAIDRMGLDEELELIFKALSTFDIDIEKSEIINAPVENNKNRIEIFSTVNHNKKIHGYLNPDNTITIKGDQEFSRKPLQGKASIFVLEKGFKKDYQEKIEIIENIEMEPEKEYKIIYKEDVTFKSPSGAGWMIKGGTNNGWMSWIVKSNGKPIDQYRKK